MTRAAEATEECAVSAQASRQRAGRRPRRSAAAWRAATRAERLPFVPPETKQPPASGGSPARSASHRSTWFSAQTAPAPSSQLPPYEEDALITRSNRTDAFVGAPGTNARKLGWSVDMTVGASTSAQIRSASSPPMPPAVIVEPARRASSSGEAGRSSGWGFEIRPRA